MKTYLRWEAYRTVRMHSSSLIPIKKYKVKVPSRGLSSLTLLAGTARTAPYNNCLRFQLVLDCWKEDPRKRPTFDQATKILEKMMMVGNTYLNLDLVDESKAYYKEHACWWRENHWYRHGGQDRWKFNSVSTALTRKLKLVPKKVIKLNVNNLRLVDITHSFLISHLKHSRKKLRLTLSLEL